MSTGRTDPGRSRPRIAAAVLTLLVPALAGCGDDAPVDRGDPEADIAREIARTLAQRARALRQRDPDAFDRTVAQRTAGFAADQETYYDNLAQLPVAALGYRVDADSVEAAGDHYWAEVEVSLRLEGYDAGPVVTHDRYRFTPSADGGRFLLSSTTDERWEARTHAQAQPWDLGEIEVRERPGVLGVFDDRTLGRADAVLATVAAGAHEVAQLVPAPEQHAGIVVYALGDPAFLEQVDGLPVDDPDRLDAATIPVPRDATETDGPVASYRVLLSPRILEQGGPGLDRLVRHELVHVAVGTRARSAPLWLSEGIAEYVSVRPIAPSERRLPAGAVDLAAGGVEDLPADELFSGQNAEAWYAVGWWVCEFLAATYGEPVLWSLLDVLAVAEDQDAAIRDMLGITPAELAAEGVGLMVATYA